MAEGIRAASKSAVTSQAGKRLDEAKAKLQLLKMFGAVNPKWAARQAAAIAREIAGAAREFALANQGGGAAGTPPADANLAETAHQVAAQAVDSGAAGDGVAAEARRTASEAQKLAALDEPGSDATQAMDGGNGQEKDTAQHRIFSLDGVAVVLRELRGRASPGDAGSPNAERQFMQQAKSALNMAKALVQAGARRQREEDTERKENEKTMAQTERDLRWAEDSLAAASALGAPSLITPTASSVDVLA